VEIPARGNRKAKAKVFISGRNGLAGITKKNVSK